MIEPLDKDDLKHGDEDVTRSFANGFIEVFGFSRDAAEWLIDIYIVFQTFDDYADGDDVSEERLSQLIYKTLVSLPSNPFFKMNSAVLLPILANSILKWKASDTAERNGNADEKSFIWRASYYDIVLAVLNIFYGPDLAMKNAHKVMEIYAEKFSEYIKEFKGD
jgi:hypothetical protein